MSPRRMLGPLVYGGLSLLAGLLFLLAASLWSDAGWGQRLGGAAWVAFLSLIILMPVVIPWARRRSS